MFKRVRDAKPTRKAALTVGKPMKWRTLARQGDFMLAALYTGNFDADADQELLTDDMGFGIWEADGSHHFVTSSLQFVRVDCTYDCDNDGIEDLLAEDFQRSFSGNSGGRDQMQAFALDGSKLGALDGVPMGPEIVEGDFDGDQRKDLYMSEGGDYGNIENAGSRAFAPGNKVIFSKGPEWNTPYLLAGDLDGDGRDELIGTPGVPGGGDQLCYTGAGKKTIAIKLPESSGLDDLSPTFAADFDGDGKAELVGGSGLVFNRASGQAFQLEMPRDYPQVFLDGVFSQTLAAFHDGDEFRLAAILGLDNFSLETLVIWDSNGKLIHARDYGELLDRILPLRSGGQDYIVLATRSRILIYP